MLRRLSGFKYLGPGNELPQERVYLVDRVAYEHDLAYDRANTRYAIIASDLKSIVQFLWTSLWALISALVLFIKASVELIICTTFYPYRFFRAMDFILGCLLFCSLLWLSIIELRIENLKHANPANKCVLATTWDTAECLLKEFLVNS